MTRVYSTRSALGVLLAVCQLFLPTVASGRPPVQREREGRIAAIAGFLTRVGVVNFVKGDVRGYRTGRDVQVLQPRNVLEKEDVVRVGRGGCAEFLLNPGYYLRLSENTEATFLGLSPDNLKVNLTSGSAIIEILVVDPRRVFGPLPSNSTMELYELVTVVTPHDELVLTGGGIYRLDVKADGVSELTVLSGSADVRGTRIESGTRATIVNGLPRVSKVGKDLDDEFDGWSRARAAELVAINKALAKSDWYTQFKRSRSSHFEIDAEGRVQDAQERKVVAATTGRVSFADDGVTFRRGGAAWERLSEGAALRDGDEVRTDVSSRCEVFLYATIQLHLTSATEVVYSKASSGGIAIRVRKGSVIVVDRLDAKNQHLVTLGAAGLDFEIAEAGEYRLDTIPGGRSELLVYRGKVRHDGRDIKGGKKATYAGTSPTVVSIGKNARDSFNIWSQQRSAVVQDRRNWYLSVYRRRRAEYGGMWYFDHAHGTHTFVPGALDFRSPYGGRYGVRFRTASGRRL
jgi:hypothetical protein